MPHAARHLAALALVVLAAIADLPASPQGAALAESASQTREYELKAAFLLNFVRYTTWPKHSFEGRRAPIILSVVGGDPFGEILEATFREEEIQGRRIEVKRFADVPETPEGHVIFCGRLTETARAELVKRCVGRACLLIGETPGFAEDGACINFFLSEQKVRFEVNPDVAAAASLEISPAVLKLAKIVRSRKEA